MTPQTLLHADYLDIIYDNRNKGYGGYQLRRTYPQRIKKAALFALSATACLCIYSYASSHYAHAADAMLNNHTKTELTAVTLPQVPPKPITIVPPAPPPAEQHIKTVANTVPKIITDDLVKPAEQMHTQADLHNVQIGAKNMDGDLTPGDMPLASGSGTGIKADVPVAPAKKVFDYVEQMPEFKGLDKFLADNLHFPKTASDNGIQGKVIIKFVVNEDGSVSNAEVLRGIGGGCDREALRVVNSMPHWKPGKQNGQPVKVYFSLPINFKLE